ncbi:MAG: hypothetical protein MUE71_09310, partial [Chitinophagaceae bacterium]|nr:hypothetical protein [Chitinophagaceae bacterium]
MRILKLAIISVVAFSFIIWGFTMLFPSVMVLSRVKNIYGSGDTLMHRFATNSIGYRQWLLPDSGEFDIRTADIPFYTSNLYNAEPQPGADTLFFEVRQPGVRSLQGGIATYQLQTDSVTTQLFYVFYTPWYKPWDKLKLMMADKQMGPQMDAS